VTKGAATVSPSPVRRKKRNLNSIVREAVLTRRYSESYCTHGFDYDWAATTWRSAVRPTCCSTR